LGITDVPRRTAHARRFALLLETFGAIGRAERRVRRHGDLVLLAVGDQVVLLEIGVHLDLIGLGPDARLLGQLADLLDA